MKIKLYSDGAKFEEMVEDYKKGHDGFTTNPSLMKKGGVTDYMAFAKKVLKEIPDRPVSFEVFSDDFDQMEKEARAISALGNNVFVKIPVTNTKGQPSLPLIKKLSAEGFKLNITAIFTLKQVEEVVEVLSEEGESIVSVFAGRVADTGVDPMPLMKEAAEICHRKRNVYLLWASTREAFNIKQAESIGCDIITVPPSILKKLDLFGKDLDEYSLETVQGFLKDATASGLSIL